MSETATLLSSTGILTREQLILVPTPPGTATHKVIPHSEVVGALVETLGFRHIAVHSEQYCVSKDGMKLFGTLELETQFHGCRFALALRNSNDKSLSLALTVGYKVFCCDNLAFHGDYSPVMKKHTKNMNLLDSLSLGIDGVQRNFEPVRRQVERWNESQISDVTAKLIIYESFIEGALDVPKHLARDIHSFYFNPVHEEFAPRTMFSLTNAYTEAFKQLDPVPLHRATASFAGFLEERKL